MRTSYASYSRPRGWAGVALGAILPFVATTLAALPVNVSTATAALVYVLAVTAAATLGGIASGLTASLASFICLNYFFTEPLHTFIATKGEDLIALVVFLLVSATTGTLISTALAQRARAEEREHEAREAREQAEINSARAALFSSVTHDLRTPLASITASVTSLLDDDAAFASEDRRELLDTIHHEAVRLNRVVGNLLDLSRMRAGALVPSRTLTGIDEVVDAVVTRLEPVLRSHTLVVRIEEGLPDLAIDVVQIDQVLTNLLENAARFSEAETPISVNADHHGEAVRIRVEDEGEGIPASDRDRVFEPFVHRAGSPGSGLGLAISRAIVEAHGGTIWIDDGRSKGASVVFELPVVA